MLVYLNLFPQYSKQGNDVLCIQTLGSWAMQVARKKRYKDWNWRDTIIVIKNDMVKKWYGYVHSKYKRIDDKMLDYIEKKFRKFTGYKIIIFKIYFISMQRPKQKNQNFKKAII